MEISTQLQGSHTTASSSGQYIASISNGKLRIHAAHLPERFTDVGVRIQAKDVLSLRWNEENNHVAVLSARNVEVVDLDDASHRIRLDNGSGGLGRFVSADFVGLHQLLTIWEFGKGKVWNLMNGKGVDIEDVKTACSGPRWQLRPDVSGSRLTLATLSRPGADDLLNLDFPVLQRTLASIKLPTTDAQSLSWAPDGRWLAIVDTPTASPSVRFYTPGGHLFRSYPPASETNTPELGVKALVWSSNSQVVALTRYDGKVVLLNAKKFALLAIIEHTSTIDQRSRPSERQAPIWQEGVSASGERSYADAMQPVSPPLSRPTPSTEPSEIGVAEARFSCDGGYLATRDERMLNTVWIWNVATLGAHTVVIQHSNVRKLHWHPTRPAVLMLDCGEGIAYVLDVSSSNPPTPFSTSISRAPTMSWLTTSEHSESVILAATRSSFRLLYPEGQPGTSDVGNNQARVGSNEVEEETLEEGASEDSLFDVLSGRKPMARKTEPSYTEMVDVEVETEEEGSTTRLDDTFVGKRHSRRPVPIDPLDDSQIF